MSVNLQKGMAWDRAKAELRSMSRAAYAEVQEEQSPPMRNVREDKWNKIDRMVEAFIKHIEDEGLEE